MVLGIMVRRVHENMIERAHLFFRQGGYISEQNGESFFQPIPSYVGRAKLCQIGLNLYPTRRNIRHTPRQSQQNPADAAAELQHLLPRQSGNGSRQKDRVHSDPVAFGRLFDLYAAIQKLVDRRFHRGYTFPMATIIPLITPARKQDPLARLSDLLAEDLAAVNQLILQRMESRVPLIPELAGHLIASGGKRLRPLLALASARLCGDQSQRPHKLAAAVEFIHTATLLHDDVVDASDLRRGEPSANALFGNQASVLVGDFLFSVAFQLMVEDGSLDVLRVLSQASATISEGEVLQLSIQGDGSASEQTYLDIVRAKTAELFAAACRVGAIVAGRAAAEEDALRAYGLNLGIAFQIVDDVLDYDARQEELGKTVGTDFREGKLTLPALLAAHRGDKSERAFWHRAMIEKDQKPGDFAQAQSLLFKHGALEDSLKRAKHYGAIARDALGLFAESPLKAALIDAVDFTIERGF